MIIYCNHVLKFQAGTSVWDNVTLTLALGITNLLYNRSVYYISNGENFWDMMSKYKINLIYLTNYEVETMYKMGMVPSKLQLMFYAFKFRLR